MNNLSLLFQNCFTKNATSNGSAAVWVVSEAERTQYAAMFIQADLDKDGFVSGLEIKDVFLQSRLPQPILAHIWSAQFLLLIFTNYMAVIC